VQRALNRGKFGNRIIIIDVCDEYEGPEISIDKILSYPHPFEFTWRIIPEDEQDIDHIFRLALAVENCRIIAEEVADYTNNPELRKTLRRGRKKNVHVVAISQRPADIHKTVTSQCALTVCFYMDGKTDRAYIDRRYGSGAVEELATLEPDTYQCCLWGEEELFDRYFTS